MPSSQPVSPAQPAAQKGSALRAAFPLTVPILAGFLLTGATCGIYATSLGLPWWAPTFMAIAIFAGSAEFIVASMLVEPFNPVAVFVTIFAVNARHLFYGLSMLDRYAHVRRRPYLIYAMCDETFSVNFAAKCPENVDESDFHFWISFLNQAYWVVGCTLGGIFGSALAVSIPGISFALTALFVVIFLDQWLKDASHVSSVIGFVAGLAALVVFGAANFMVPALVLILVTVTLVRGKVEPAYLAPEKPGRPSEEGEGAQGDDPETGLDMHVTTAGASCDAGHHAACEFAHDAGADRHAARNAKLDANATAAGAGTEDSADAPASHAKREGTRGGDR